MVDLRLWRLDRHKATRIEPAAADVAWDQPLESYIESDPSILGEMLLIGRKVPNPGGCQIDLLAIGESGTVLVIVVMSGEARSDSIPLAEERHPCERDP